MFLTFPYVFLCSTYARRIDIKNDMLVSKGLLRPGVEATILRYLPSLLITILSSNTRPSLEASNMALTLIKIATIQRKRPSVWDRCVRTSPKLKELIKQLKENPARSVRDAASHVLTD